MKLFFLITSYLLLVTSYCLADTLNRAEALYLQGSYSESIEECALNIARNRMQDEAYYLLGLNYLKINDGEKAREKLKFLMDNFSDSRYREAAKLAYADAYFIEQDYSKAKQIYEDMIKTGGRLTGTAYLRLYQCALKSGQWQLAKEYATILRQKYPLSLEAHQVLEPQAIDDLFFTVQVGSFANIQNAAKLLNKLKKQDFGAYIDELNSSGSPLYRVRVGKLKQRPEAETLKKLLEEKGYPTRIYP